jgi:hypothetical protein
MAELDGSGAVVSRFVYGDKANVPEYVIRSDVTRMYTRPASAEWRTTPPRQ